MIQRQGDFFSIAEELKPQVLVVTTNNVIRKDGRLTMGAGIALEFREKFAELDREFADLIKDRTPNIYSVREFAGYQAIIYSLQTKFHWKNPSDMSLIIKSCAKLRTFVDDLNIKSVLMTRPGCGNGGLDWDEVYKYIKDIFDSRFTIVYQ